MVSQGLRPAGFVWMLNSPHSGNWHPLTTLSHMLDCSLFGLSPRPMHWENVFWHAINAALLFFVWRKITGARWLSAAVAALFALHPLRVESVAWISERKDVLSNFFFLLTLLFYARYVEAKKLKLDQPTPEKQRVLSNYSLALLFFALGLLSKPMLVTLPFALLLLDFWPLGRVSSLKFQVSSLPASTTSNFKPQTSNFYGLLLEKIPFFTLTFIFCVITFVVQRSDGAMKFGHSLGLASRLQNAPVSYLRYLQKTFWPDALAIFYPHPSLWPMTVVLCAVTFIFLITGLALSQVRQRPWILFGWLWFLGILVPVIGLVQVGSQSMADRFTYIPHLGIFTAVVWTVAEISKNRPKFLTFFASATVLLLGICFWLTGKQVRVWQNGITLFEHNLVCTGENVRSRLYLADALDMAGRPESVVLAQCRRALEVDSGNNIPSRILALMEISNLAMRHQRFDEARSKLDEAHRLDPNHAGVIHALGVVALQEGHSDEALSHFNEALRIDPMRGATHREIAKIFFEQKRLDDCRTHLEAAIKANRWDYISHGNLGVVLRFQGRVKESEECFKQALWINPRCAEPPKQ